MPKAKLITALACLLALTACGSPAATPSPTATPTTASPTPSPSPSVKVSDSLAAIKVTGGFGKQPKISVKTPFTIDKTRVDVLSAGKGRKALADGWVSVDYHGVNGRTGEVFDSSFTRGAPASFSLARVVTGFKTGLTGQAVGSRVLIAMPGSDGYDASGGSADGSIQVGDTLIFVVDILDASVAQPTGKTVTPPSGLPTVTGGAADSPTVTIPSGSAPSSMSATVLIEGDGAKVTKKSTIVARYVGYSWKTGKLIDDQFATVSEGELSSTIPGWQTGLVGKRAGSRVLLVLPPKDGFPQGSNNPPVEAGDTVVYVVDVLFAYTQG